MDETPTPVSVIRYTDHATGARVLAETPVPVDIESPRAASPFTPSLPALQGGN